MIVLRNFDKADAEMIQKYGCMTSIDEVETMIEQWNTKEFNGSYFEMFAIVDGDSVVGCISLWGKSKKIASIGPEVYEPYRKRGYGKAALEACMDIAMKKGYKIIVQQIRENNVASIALHKSLGFETDGYLFRNRHNNAVYIYMKTL